MSKYCSFELFSNEGVIQFIQSNGHGGKCDYLNKQSTVIELKVLCQFILDCVHKKYEDAAETVPYESAEGGYLFDTLTLYDIITDDEYITDQVSNEEEEVYRDIIDQLNDNTPYVRKHFFGLPSGSSDGIYNWSNFSELLKTKQRYTSFHKSGENEFMEANPVEEFLTSLANVFRDENILISLNKGTKVFRARIDNEKLIKEYVKLASPPSKLSNHNRFSPQGISFFYGALDIDSCIAEIRPSLSENVTVGCFEVKNSIIIADFVNGLGEIKDIYDEDYDFDFDEFFKPFLNEFIKEISKPIRPSDSSLDYIPTQAFVECLRFVLDLKIDGISFKSSANEGGENIVLFRGDDILDGNDGWLSGTGIEYKLIEKIKYSVK